MDLTGKLKDIRKVVWGYVMYDFIHEHCFLVPYSVLKHHLFQFSEEFN